MMRGVIVQVCGYALGRGRAKRTRSLVPVWPNLCALLFLFSLAVPAAAHEMRPAYLELRETRAGEFSVLWKTPMRGEARLALMPEFSGATEATPAVTRAVAGAAVQTWTLRAAVLRGQTLRIRGARKHDDGRARAYRVCRWHVVDATADARAPAAVIPDAASGVGGERRLSLARGRAHPAGYRSPAVRPRTPAHHARRLDAGEDRHGVHDRA